MSDEDTEVRVNIRTTEERRESWKEYAATNDDVDSMSHLIHRAVAQYTARGGDTHGGQSADGAAVDAVMRQLDSLATAVDDVATTVDDINERLDAVEEEIGITRDVEAADVVRALPPAEPQSDDWTAMRQGMPDEDDPSSPVAWDGTVTAVADHLSDATSSVSEEQIGDMLNRLKDTPAVKSAVVEGRMRYFSPEKSAAVEVRGEAPPEARGEGR